MITTNATLISGETAEFLLSNGFTVQVSLDGPMEIHDCHRRDVNQEGSYEKTFRGLERLADAREMTGKGEILLNMVYAPPYSAEKLERIHHYLKTTLRTPIRFINTTYPSEGTIPPDSDGGVRKPEDKSLLRWAYEQYRNDFERSEAWIRNIIEKPLARLMQRPVFNTPRREFLLNGCCLPGQRKCYIDGSGLIRVCEKVTDKTPVIGHVDKGFDYGMIEQHFINGYEALSFPDCSACWGVGLCTLCYYAAFNTRGELDLQRKRSYCRNFLKGQEELLGIFGDLLAESPDRMKYLYDIELA